MARLVVAVSSREIKTALFLALHGITSVTIVATATTTAELASYCRAFRPEIVIVDEALPGRPLDETLTSLGAVMPDCRFLLVSNKDRPPEAEAGTVEVFRDVDQLVAAVPEAGAETG